MSTPGYHYSRPRDVPPVQARRGPLRARLHRWRLTAWWWLYYLIR